jgi:hypothetical protein
VLSSDIEKLAFATGSFPGTLSTTAFTVPVPLVPLEVNVTDAVPVG